LNDILKANPDKKEEILKFMREYFQKLIDKGGPVLSYNITHVPLLQYLQYPFIVIQNMTTFFLFSSSFVECKEIVNLMSVYISLENVCTLTLQSTPPFKSVLVMKITKREIAELFCNFSLSFSNSPKLTNCVSDIIVQSDSSVVPLSPLSPHFLFV
jgi:hypothetical protein